MNDNIVGEVTKFLKGENKPSMVFEFSYENLIFIFLGTLFTIVASALIVKSLTS